MTNSILRLLCAAVLTSFACVACAPAAKRGEPAPAAGRVDDAAVNALYAEIDRAAAQGEDGIVRWRNGDATGASTALTGARELLTAAAGRCVATPGCEIERVLLAQDALLDRQARELLGPRGDEADATDATPEPESAGSPVVHAMPQAARSVALLKGRALRDVITMNASVQAALEEWLTWMRPNLLEAYENYQYMRHRMWPAYERAGLPEALLFGVLAKESGGKVHAVSRAGASGPLQFMYYTGVRYGLGKRDGFDSRFDPGESTRANVEYLNDQFRTFNNSLELALAAYNGGEGRVGRLSRAGSRSFWDPQVYNALPPETREYVPMVLAAAWLFLHPEQYNLEFPQVDARVAQVKLRSAASLNELAICLGQEGNARGWFRTLRNLNPRWEPNQSLAAGTTLEMPQSAATAYERSCVSGPLVALSRELHAASPPIAPAYRRVAGGGGRTHVVRRGETLSSIARKFGCRKVAPIASANRLKAPRYEIRAGQKLVVPSCG